MTNDITGRGNLVKTLQLLWGRHASPKRGPQPKARLKDIVAAAMRIADAEGLNAVSTRRVADAVGISAMSIYTYVPGKPELLDLMMDAALQRVGKRPTFVPGHWRKSLTRLARDSRELYLRHPWLLELATHRPVLGPNTMAAYDKALAALDGVGLDAIEMDLGVTVIFNYVYGAVRDAARAKLVKDATGMSDDEWWAATQPFLETLDYSPYPVAARVGAIAGEAYGLGDSDRAFEFGLELLLDGLERRIATRPARRRRTDRIASGSRKGSTHHGR